MHVTFDQAVTLNDTARPESLLTNGSKSKLGDGSSHLEFTADGGLNVTVCGCGGSVVVVVVVVVAVVLDVELLVEDVLVLVVEELDVDVPVDEVLLVDSRVVLVVEVSVVVGALLVVDALVTLDVESSVAVVVVVEAAVDDVSPLVAGLAVDVGSAAADVVDAADVLSVVSTSPLPQDVAAIASVRITARRRPTGRIRAMAI